MENNENSQEKRYPRCEQIEAEVARREQELADLCRPYAPYAQALVQYGQAYRELVNRPYESQDQPPDHYTDEEKQLWKDSAVSMLAQEIRDLYGDNVL